MSEHLQPLLELDLIVDGEVNVRKIADLPFADLLDVIDAVASASVARDAPTVIQGLSHCASIPMGGGPGECSSLSCRLERAEELARFVALYSDGTYFHNFMADRSPSFGHAPKKDTPQARRRIAEDIAVLLRLQPLIESGLLMPYSTPRAFCPVCFADAKIGKGARTRIKAALQAISRDLLESMQIEIEYVDKSFVLTLKTDKNIYGHDVICFRKHDAPKALSGRPALLQRIKSGKSLVASKALKRDLAFNKLEARGIVYSAAYQLAVSHQTGAFPLTYRQIDIDAVDAISADRDLRRRNAILFSSLKSVVPYAEDVPIEKLVELRAREHEAFLRFRAALREAIRGVSGEGSGISEHIARQLHADILAPEVARLDQAVAKAKSDLIRTPAISIAGVAGSIFIGTYTGLLPTDLTAIASALGLTKLTNDLINKVGALSDTTGAIRQDKFYYLWKVKHAMERYGQEH